MVVMLRNDRSVDWLALCWQSADDRSILLHRMLIWIIRRLQTLDSIVSHADNKVGRSFNQDTAPV
jgi:hypothetical protein